MSKSKLNIKAVWPLSTLDKVVNHLKQRMAVVIVVENFSSFEQDFILSGLAHRLVQADAALFALIGKDSEEAHDSLDWSLVDMNVKGVLTSWHDGSDLGDIACFVVTSCKAQSLNCLILVIDETSDVGKKLKKSIEEFIDELG